jgi:hypothetical protein
MNAPILLKAPVDSFGLTATACFDLDSWFDGANVWLLAATDIDVLVLKDQLFEHWRDQEVAPSPITTVAYEVAFAPDFNTSNLMWAVIDYLGAVYVTSTISPGQWGNTVADIAPQNVATNYIAATMICELDFAETYTAAAPVVYLACSSGANDGNVFEIRGSYTPGGTQAIPLLLADSDCTTVEVSGSVILVGKYYSFAGTVVRSDNLGDTFTQTMKPPTGFGNFNVEMAPGMFDPDTGHAYCSSQFFVEDEGAFSISVDGGQTWNQNSWVDTFNDATSDVAFSPLGGSQPAFMITRDILVTGRDSLWRSNDVTATVATWVRVQTSGFMGLVNFWKVEYAMDGSCVMLYGTDGVDLEIWKSTDNGQTFNHWRTLPATADNISDLVVYDGSTIFAACADTNGFYGTTRFGPAKERLPGVIGASIVLQPGFDPDDPANSVVIVGANNGRVYISADAGATWGAAQVLLGHSGNVYVAFDADFANNGLIYLASDGGTVISQATVLGTALTAVKTLLDDPDNDGVGDNAALDLTGFTGIAVSADNALYAMSGSSYTSPTSGSLTVAGDLTLLGVTSGASVSGANEVAFSGIEVTPVSGPAFTSEPVDPISGLPTVLKATGYNSVEGVIYITDVGPNSSGYFNITLTGLQLDNVAVPFSAGEDVTVGEGTNDWDVTVIPGGTTTVTTANWLWRILLHEDNNIWEIEPISNAMGLWQTEGSNYVWTKVVGTMLYGLQDTCSGPVAGVSVGNIGETSAVASWSATTGAMLYEYSYNPTGTTAATSATLSPLTDNTPYTFKVRVAPGAPFASRWSSGVNFTTLEAIAAPVPRVPAQGLQGAPLLPSFVWDAVSNAVSYDFQLSVSPDFSTTIVDTSIAAPVTGYTCEVMLAYDTNHYWRVRARSATGTISAWCTIQNFHTVAEEEPPITIEPPPTPTIDITVDLPQPTVTVVPPDVNVTVEPPDVIVDIPPVVTVTQTEAGPVTHIIPLPDEEEPPTPIYIWVIVGIGAVLTISVIVLIIRTRRVV